MELQTIQTKVKEGQALLSSYLEKGLKNSQVETLVQSGRELLEREDVKQVVNQGEKWIAQMEQVRGQLQDRVTEVESQGRAILQSRFSTILAGVRSIEGELVQLADKAIEDGHAAVDGKFPILQTMLDSAKAAVSLIDAKFASLQAVALASSGSLPIRDFDKLNAKAAAAAVKKLGKADLLIVQSYETRNKNRSTVLNEITALLADN